jgi:hypothetical protein
MIGGNSAIVGEEFKLNTDAFDFHYEKNVSNAVNLKSFESKVKSAIWKRIEDLPTLSRGSCPKSSMKIIGEAVYSNGQVKIDIKDKKAYNKWLLEKKYIDNM